MFCHCSAVPKATFRDINFTASTSIQRKYCRKFADLERKNECSRSITVESSCKDSDKICLNGCLLYTAIKAF